jgi:inosine-uridine nucleoside N-ribohydrolase
MKNTTLENKKIPVLLDCDPGADDTFALLWLLVNHQFAHIPMEIVGITSVGGNVSADKTYANVHRMCQFVGAIDAAGYSSIPVGKDHRQIVAQDASHIHGNDGIGNLSAMLPEVKLPVALVGGAYPELDSIDMIIDAISTHGHDLIILVTGPMTNLAAAEARVPGILSRCQRIIAMGGAIHVPGNITPVAEFNVYYDAPSAAAVFAATDNIRLAPLDITTSMVFTAEDTENSFKQINHDTKQEFIRKLTEFTIGTNTMFRETGYEKGFYVHDAHTVGMLLYPHLYSGTFHDISVETHGDLTTGQTIVDTRNHARTQVNAYVATSFDKARFLEAMTEDMKTFDFSV